MSRAGALLAARFSFMPNRLGYCGPEENRAMLDYLAEGHSDRGLEQILARFAGAFPYYSVVADQGDSILVERRPLRFVGEAITLGPPTPRSIFRRFDGKPLLTDVSPGDVVAIHWGGACHRLTMRQVRYPSHYTRPHLALANAQRRGTRLLE